MFQILKELKDPKYKMYPVYVSMKEEYIPKYREVLLQYDMKHCMFVKTGTKTYKRLLATAKFLITDTSFPPYYIKRENQVYLNTWHGTPLKAMGRIVPNREYGLGNVQRNFFIADYLLYQQEFSRDIFLRDYMIEHIYPGKILTWDIPETWHFSPRRDMSRFERRWDWRTSRSLSICQPGGECCIRKKCQADSDLGPAI